MHFLPRTILFFVFICPGMLLEYGCKSSGSASESPTSAVLRSIEMDRSVCMQGCPEYTLKVFEDGRAEFYGKGNVDKLGNFVGQVDVEFNKLLWRTVDGADLKSKKGKYGMGNEDTQEITIKYVGEDFKKEIIFQSFEPIEINEIERHLKIIAENTEWKKPEE